MKISIDRKKVEAVRRMELLGIYPETIQQFEKHNLVSVSEPPLGAFFGRVMTTLAYQEFRG